jgi:hypothetical protein
MISGTPALPRSINDCRRTSHNFFKTSTAKPLRALCFYRERATFLQPASCVIAFEVLGQPWLLQRQTSASVGEQYQTV